MRTEPVQDDRELVADADTVIEWAERKRSAEPQLGHEKLSRSGDFCDADIAEDSVGLPSGVEPDSDEIDPVVAADKIEIECGYSVEDECPECEIFLRPRKG